MAERKIALAALRLWETQRRWQDPLSHYAGLAVPTETIRRFRADGLPPAPRPPRAPVAAVSPGSPGMDAGADLCGRALSAARRAIVAIARGGLFAPQDQAALLEFAGQLAALLADGVGRDLAAAVRRCRAEGPRGARRPDAIPASLWHAAREHAAFCSPSCGTPPSRARPCCAPRRQAPP